MLKHMEDNADLNILVDDTGSIVVICSKCKKLWSGKLIFAESITSEKNIKQLMNTALKVNPLLLKNLGID